MTRSLSACALALGLGLACSAQETTIRIDPLWDSIALSSGLGAALASELFLDSAGNSGAKLDASSLSGPDVLACLPYDEGMSKASMAAEGVALLWPALFALSGSSGELMPAAASYAEALAWTYAAKNCLKYVFPKARPYVYHSGNLSEELQDEAYESFPSGHAALAFCAATSFAVLAFDLSPNSPATPWLVAGGYVVAATAATLRVAAGEHFVGDVAAGALLGSAIGYIATSLHMKSDRVGTQRIGSSAQSAFLSLSSGPSLIFTLGL
jgi:membrane-associated phospholipid phosphatase